MRFTVFLSRRKNGSQVLFPADLLKHFWAEHLTFGQVPGIHLNLNSGVARCVL